MAGCQICQWLAVVVEVVTQLRSLAPIQVFIKKILDCITCAPVVYDAIVCSAMPYYHSFNSNRSVCLSLLFKAGSGGNSGDNSGEESGMTSSPLQIEDFADLVDTPSPLVTPNDEDNLLCDSGRMDTKNDNQLDLNATNLSHNGSRSNHNSANGNNNVATSVSQFRSLETETNFTDLDIDEKFFDNF